MRVGGQVGGGDGREVGQPGEKQNVAFYELTLVSFDPLTKDAHFVVRHRDKDYAATAREGDALRAMHGSKLFGGLRVTEVGQAGVSVHAEWEEVARSSSQAG